MDETGRILVARIGAPHGVRGEVRLTAFGDDPAALIGYGPLATRDGRTVRIAGLKAIGDRLVARLKGISDRNAAEALTNLDLYVDRAKLPPPEDEDTFYHADLIGLAAETLAGAPLGTIVAVPNFGAGDLLEIAPLRGATLLVPFTKVIVPTVDLAGRRVLVDPPAGLLEPAKPGEERDEAEAAARDAGGPAAGEPSSDGAASGGAEAAASGEADDAAEGPRRPDRPRTAGRGSRRRAGKAGGTPGPDGAP